MGTILQIATLSYHSYLKDMNTSFPPPPLPHHLQILSQTYTTDKYLPHHLIPDNKFMNATTYHPLHLEYPCYTGKCYSALNPKD